MNYNSFSGDSHSHQHNNEHEDSQALDQLYDSHLIKSQHDYSESLEEDLDLNNEQQANNQIEKIARKLHKQNGITKIEKRRLQNRRSALRCRMKKVNLIETLSKEVGQLREEKILLSKEVETLRYELLTQKQLQKDQECEIFKLKTQLERDQYPAYSEEQCYSHQKFNQQCHQPKTVMQSQYKDPNLNQNFIAQPRHEINTNSYIQYPSQIVSHPVVQGHQRIVQTQCLQPVGQKVIYPTQQPLSQPPIVYYLPPQNVNHLNQQNSLVNQKFYVL